MSDECSGCTVLRNVLLSLRSGWNILRNVLLSLRSSGWNILRNVLLSLRSGWNILRDLCSTVSSGVLYLRTTDRDMFRFAVYQENSVECAGKFGPLGTFGGIFAGSILGDRRRFAVYLGPCFERIGYLATPASSVCIPSNPCLNSFTPLVSKAMLSAMALVEASRPSTLA